MDSNSASSHGDWIGQTTKRTAASTGQGTVAPLPTGRSHVHILSNAMNNHIHGNTFITNVKAEALLGALYQRTAPNAILNAGGRADRVGCHPGTRVEVIDRIWKWGGSPTANIFWLCGPAGSGKSAIVQTIAERCKECEVPHANFFFFQADNSRSSVHPLVATLLHQIILLYPSLRDPVATVLDTNPLLFDSPLEDQLVKLVVAPLRLIQQSSSHYRSLIILIDGLDECDSATKRSQQQILHAFDKVLLQHPGLFCLLVASRDDSHIRAAFKRVSSPCSRLYLDDQYSPERDIRAFVIAQFEEVKNSHPLAYTLDTTWPPPEDVNYIVEKSSGQFVFSATVMRSILESSASPALSLERVKGAARFATKTPFTHLDAIYTDILSQVDDQDALKDILRVELLKETPAADEPRLSKDKDYTRGSLIVKSKATLLETLTLYDQRYTKALFLSCLADITSIASYDFNRGKLLFYHGSFADYLLDQSRSGDYFVDIPAFSYKILPVVWHIVDGGLRWIEFGVRSLCQLQKLPPGLMDMLSASKYAWSLVHWQDCDFFVFLFKLCIHDDDVTNFKRIIRPWVDETHDKCDFDYISHLPFSRRYVRMFNFWQNRWVLDITHPTMAALRPETDFDRDELASWINDTMDQLRKSVDAERYNHHAVAFMNWANENAIPCESIALLPAGYAPDKEEKEDILSSPRSQIRNKTVTTSTNEVSRPAREKEIKDMLSSRWSQNKTFRPSRESTSDFLLRMREQMRSNRDMEKHGKSDHEETYGFLI